jgi:hypothetical protein
LERKKWWQVIYLPKMFRIHEKLEFKSDNSTIMTNNIPDPIAYNRRQKPTDQSIGVQRKNERYFEPVEKVFREFESMCGVNPEQNKKRKKSDGLSMVKR